ncbi:MAG: hypothetical protein ACLRR3_11955 [Eubacterium sp.]
MVWLLSGAIVWHCRMEVIGDDRLLNTEGERIISRNMKNKVRTENMR